MRWLPLKPNPNPNPTSRLSRLIWLRSIQEYLAAEDLYSRLSNKDVNPVFSKFPKTVLGAFDHVGFLQFLHETGFLKNTLKLAADLGVADQLFERSNDIDLNTFDVKVDAYLFILLARCRRGPRTLRIQSNSLDSTMKWLSSCSALTELNLSYCEHLRGTLKHLSNLRLEVSACSI